MTPRELAPRDVERIVRDVLLAQGLAVSVLQAQPTSAGWQVTVTDAADRFFTMDLPRERPAIIREAVTRWAESWS